MSTKDSTLNYREKYEDNLIMGVCAILLGLGYKGIMKKEILPVTGARKIVETFLVVVVATIAGEELTEKLRKEGYLK